MENLMNLETTKVRIVNSITEVQDQVNLFQREGYLNDNIFVLTHDKDRTSRIVEKTDATTIGMAEEGFGTTIANMFRSTGDELRAKMRSLGISKADSERLETEMDRDKVLVIAWSGKEYVGEDYDPAVYYYTYY
ncbi:MAG: general stress protein [Candidatus Pristimantibacillus lignocellulolyticus]|uniref:General stress protein n=1 Tax=Candidatus Pristimantibacillus lignocellulolyticus TaxID=2994561 RepID=A0A9J6ZH03_9BACL|nr:MAG: general stress protein [Candidatus Pristimantibacillus lignocellulolyticus]